MRYSVISFQAKGLKAMCIESLQIMWTQFDQKFINIETN